MVIVSIRTYACTYFIIKFSNLKPVNEIKKRKNEKLFKPLVSFYAHKFFSSRLFLPVQELKQALL